MERYIACDDDSLRECELDLMSKLIEPHLVKLHNYDAQLCIIIMERYRSGHNGADSKSVCANAHEGSNPSLSAKKQEASSFEGASCFFERI